MKHRQIRVTAKGMAMLESRRKNSIVIKAGETHTLTFMGVAMSLINGTGGTIYVRKDALLKVLV